MPEPLTALPFGPFLFQLKLKVAHQPSNAAAPVERHPQLPGHDEIMAGCPLAAINEAAEAFGIAAVEMAERIGVSPSAFHRKQKKDARLSACQFDALVRHLMLLAKALSVFDGDKEATRRWLTTSQIGLGGAVPIDLAETTPGVGAVETLLLRIDYGVYA